MNINEVYKLVSYLVDKYQGTYLSPDDFNAVINMAQIQYLASLTEDSGAPTRNPKSPTGMTSSATISDMISTFITESNLTITSQIANKPNNLYKTLAIRTTDDNYAVRYVPADRVASHIDNAIDPPSATDPMYYELGSTFKFFPNTLASAKITYVRNPQTLKWNYTGNLQYSPSTSVPQDDAALEWGDTDVYEIVYRAVGIIGINLKDGDLVGAARAIKNEGL